MNELKKRKGVIALLDAIEPILMAFAIFMMVYLFLWQPHRVDGKSMYPNFDDSDFILTDKISYRRGEPERGDVVVFHAPPPYNEDFIKRIIGLPGETVMIKEGKVYINDSELKESYLPGFVTTQRSFLRDGIPYKVPEGYYFVMGDNRGFSSDSREWGPVSKKSIVGKAWLRYWPPNKMGSFSEESY